MEDHYLIRVLEWASGKPDGFTYDELVNAFEFTEWQTCILHQYLKRAYSNANLTAIGSPNPRDTDTIFVATTTSGNFTDAHNRYGLTHEALFSYVDYQELKIARTNAIEAKRQSARAITVSILALAASVIVPFLISLWMTQTVRIESEQGNTMLGR